MVLVAIIRSFALPCDFMKVGSEIYRSCPLTDSGSLISPESRGDSEESALSGLDSFEESDLLGLDSFDGSVLASFK